MFSVLALGCTLYRICPVLGVYPVLKSRYWVCKSSVIVMKFITILFLQEGLG